MGVGVQKERIQIALCLHRALLATHRNRDVRIVFAVELVGSQPLQENDSVDFGCFHSSRMQMFLYIEVQMSLSRKSDS